MRFTIDDLIIYGETGVCRVIDIIEKEFLGELRPCYKLQPLYQSCVIFTPADNEVIFMRPIISSDEANRLISSIPQVSPVPYSASSPRELSEKYDKIIKLHDCSELIKLCVSIHAKRNALIAGKKKLSAIDERYLKRAEDLLCGELAAALDIEKYVAHGYVEEKINK